MGKLRQALSDRMAVSLARRDKSLADLLLANAFFLRHQLPLLRRQGPAGLAMWSKLHRALVHSGINFHELRLLGDDLSRVEALRDELFLQVDLQALNRREAGPGDVAMDRKSAFARAAQAHALPHVPTVPVPADRAATALAEVAALPGPVFVKPDRANRARGTALLEQRGAEDWALTDRSGTASGTLTALLARHCPGEALVAQPLLCNHPAIADLVGPVLLTLRVITGCDGAGAHTLSVLAEMPLDESKPLARRWGLLPVDLASGRLARADPARPRPIDPHPLTGHQLANFALPGFAAARACAERAHMLIEPQRSMLGWDLALTGEGPVLIEGNINWAIVTHCCNSAGFDPAAAQRFARFAARRRA